MPKYAKWVDPVKPTAAFDVINKIMEERIMVIDGAMGTAVQKYKLTEADFRGERFKNHTYPEQASSPAPSAQHHRVPAGPTNDALHLAVRGGPRRSATAPTTRSSRRTTSRWRR